MKHAFYKHLSKVLFFFMLISLNIGLSQTYNMSNTPISTCAGTFYDNGGSGGNYNDAVSLSQTFTSDNGNRISFAFSSFSTYSSADVLRIYDGPDNTYPLIGAYSGGWSPGTVVSSGTSLTFVFSPNNAGSSTAGWAASISCTSPVLTVYNMSGGTVNACEGAFYDNGGSTGNYSLSENRIQTFCSDNGQHIKFDFQYAFNLASGDTLFVYDGATVAASPIAVLVAGSYPEPITSTGTCLTFKFKSDATTQASGWQAFFSCTSSAPAPVSYNMTAGVRYTCGGTFFDDGGAGGNYNDAVNHTQTFTSYNGNRISFNFSSFSTYSTADYLRIYDGPDASYPLIGTYSLGGSPGIVTSTGSSLTFIFNVNNASSSAGGWAATISCTTPALTPYNMSSGTVNACSGAFYDSGGGNGSYAMSENRTQTFCSNNGQYLQFTFNNTAFSLGSGDTLFVFDGPSVSSNPLAVYVSGSFVETLTSTGTCLTFRFKSDATANAGGWAATFECVASQPAPVSFNMSSGVRYTCGGSFFDDGGAAGNYNDAVNHTQTFTSYNGNRISFNFSYFSTYSTADYLRIYDGPDASYPLIGTYSMGGSPGIVTSTGSSLTFIFNVNNASSSAGGWAATISCTTPVLPVINMSSGTVNACAGVFYDSGGSNQQYANSEDRIQTFCSNNGQYINFDFNMASFSLGAGDTLLVYDGSSVSASPLAVYVSGSVVEPITSSGTCLTFRFKSNAATTAIGWQAVFSCVASQPAPVSYNMSSGVRYTCGGTFYDDGGPSGNYNDAVSHSQTFTSYNGNRISVNFSSFSTSTSADYMSIYDGPNSSYPLIGSYSVASNPGLITSTGSSLTFIFNVNNLNSSAAGWAATISCTTPVLPVFNMSSGTVNACEGVFYDREGANANYAMSDNRTQTFCSDNGQFISFTFNQAAFNLNSGDTLFIYDGSSASSNPLSVLVAGSRAETVTSTGTCLTFRFISNATTNAIGWQASFNCVSTQPSPTTYMMSSGVRYTCGGTFTDDGGPSGNYNDAVSHVQTFTSYNGERLSFVFSSFNTATSADYMSIYDGPNTSYPFLGTYSVGGSPGTITSTGSSLTFVFNVNNAGSSSTGWQASINCVGPILPVYNMSSGTTTACSGVFYDFGGASANYPASENRVQTFCSDNGEYIKFTFNNQSFNLASGDSLFVYDGSSPSSQPLAIYVGGSYAETITSSGTCLTFKFKSDAGSTASGWQASFNCTSTPASAPVFNMSGGVRYTCGATFYDDGGASGNYNDYVNHVQTFISTGGCGLRATFTSLSTSTSADYLRIYDGPTTASPLIGTYSVASNPGIIQGSGSALTFQFVTNGLGSSAAGFAATLTCPNQTAPPVVTSNSPVCEGDSIKFTTANIPGAAFSWSGPNGYSSSAQSLVIPVSTLADAGSYQVSAIVGGCASNQTLVNVQVSPRPAAPVASNSGPVCSGSSLSLNSSVVSGASYSWSGPNGFNSTSQNPVIPIASASATGTYSVSATVGVCVVKASTAAVVNPSPQFSSVSSNGPVCEGSTLNLSASASNTTSYSWTGPNGFTGNGSSVSIPAVTTSATGTYTVSASNANCSSQATVQTIVSTAPATPVITGSTTVCQNAAISLSATSSAGASYSWTGPNGFSSALQNPVISSSTASNAGSYTVTSSLNGCSSTSSVNVVVNPIPSSPVASNDGPVCNNSTLNLSASSVSGATYSWSGPGGYSSSLQNPTVSNATFSNSGTYTVVAIVNGCLSSASSTSVIVNTIAPIASSNGAMCEGDSLQLQATTIPGATYSWTGPNGFTSSLEDPVINPLQIFDAGSYNVVATIGTCTSAASSVAVAVNPVPSPPSVSGNGPLCSGNQLSLTAGTIAGATYQWSGPAGFNTSAQNPVISNASVSNSGTYTVHAILNGCSSAPVSVTVIVNQTPGTPSITSNAPLCENGTLILGSPSLNGATYNWSGPGGYFSSSQNPIIDSIDASMAGSYSLVVTVNGCSSNAGIESVTIYNAPAAPVITWNSTLGILQSDYTSGNQWYLSGNMLNGETSQSLYYPVYGSNGPYSVSYTDGNGCSSISTSFTVGPVSVSDHSTLPGFSVYPNPSQGRFNVDVPMLDGNQYSLKIFNVTGELVYEKNSDTSPDKIEIETDLPSGSYLIHLKSGEKSMRQQVIITR